MNVKAFILVLFLSVGSFYLALADPKYRELFAGFAQVGMGGFLGQLVPSDKR